MSATLEAPPRSRATGFIEAMTATAALGWAWDPDGSGPLTVELRLGEQVLASGLADGPRDDLARGGIGDGKHAFSLPVPEAYRARLSELRVFARLPDGSAIPLGAPPAADPIAERLSQLQRGVDMLMGSQRVLHRNLQAVLLKTAPDDADRLAEIKANQAALQSAVETLEVFVVRLEAGVAADRSAGPAPPPRLGLAAVGAVSLLALIASCWALFRTVLG